MALTSPKMSLTIWNQLSDAYDHAQLADNWSKVDFHDHTPGRGVQIPTEGIADGAVTSAKLASTLDPSLGYATYKDLVRSNGVNSAPSAGTYLLMNGIGAFTNPLAVANSNAFPGVFAFYFDPTDYAVTGRTTVLRIRASVHNNAVAPATTFNFGLYPLGTIGGASGAAPFINTLGTQVSGSTVSIASPSASVVTVVTGSDFTAPAAGMYCLAVNLSGSTAANSFPGYSVQLQVRQV